MEVIDNVSTIHHTRQEVYRANVAVRGRSVCHPAMRGIAA